MELDGRAFKSEFSTKRVDNKSLEREVDILARDVREEHELRRGNRNLRDIVELGVLTGNRRMRVLFETSFEKAVEFACSDALRASFKNAFDVFNNRLNVLARKSGDANLGRPLDELELEIGGAFEFRKQVFGLGALHEIPLVEDEHYAQTEVHRESADRSIEIADTF